MMDNPASCYKLWKLPFLGHVFRWSISFPPQTFLHITTAAASMSHTTWLTSILKVCVCVCGREIHPFLLTRNRSFGRCNRLMNKSLKEGKCSSLGERFSSRFCHHLDSLTGEKGGLRGGRGIFLTDDYGSPKEHIILLCFERMWESRRGTSLSLNVVVENFPGDVFSLEFPCVLIVCLRGGSPNLVWKFVSDNCRIGGR